MHKKIAIKKYPYKILQLTDLHLGFGLLSKAKDEKTKDGIIKTISQAKPDLIVLTGDLIYPFMIFSGTRDNIKQATKLTAFMDSFKIPYALVFGNHDVEMSSKGSKEELAEIFNQSLYGIFEKGQAISGVGNYIIELTKEGCTKTALGLLDSNMYSKACFFSGFDYIHDDQVQWLKKNLMALKEENTDMNVLLFYHMPLIEFKEAYEKMKLGDKEITYHFGSIHEKNEYFGISRYRSKLFKTSVEMGFVKGMFCGHDHLNTLSLTYQGIQMTYGMSMDYLAYNKIKDYYIQRGGTLIEIQEDGSIEVSMVPIDRVVSKFVRGKAISD